MWRCDYCRARFGDRDTGINHARARHSRDYTACRQEAAGGASPSSARPGQARWLPSVQSVSLLPQFAVAVLIAPLLAALRPGSLSS